MDLREATIQLNRPLRFGDQHQIDAKYYLAMLDELRMRMRLCHWCRGHGFRPCGAGGKLIQCGCIRNEPRQVKEDLGIYRAMEGATSSGSVQGH